MSFPSKEPDRVNSEELVRYVHYLEPDAIIRVYTGKFLVRLNCFHWLAQFAYIVYIVAR